jgi:hypothetical protein
VDALSILLLLFLVCLALGSLILLGIEHRANLRRIEEKQDANAKAVAERLTSERPCMLRDMTEKRRED